LNKIDGEKRARKWKRFFPPLVPAKAGTLLPGGMVERTGFPLSRE
jgi:hypothetical protein